METEIIDARICGVILFSLVLICFRFRYAGGVLFKVYVIGNAIKVVRRYSLPDLGEGDQVGFGVKSFPRVSSAAATAEEADLDPEVAGMGLFLTPTDVPS